MIVKIFPPKNAVKMYVCILCHKTILTLVLKKKRHFFHENWQQSTKIMAVTLPPDWSNDK
jgi:hypothetical protein